MTKTPTWQPLNRNSKVAVIAGGRPFIYRDNEEDFEKYREFLCGEGWFEDPQLEIFLTEKDYYGMSDTPKKRAEFIVKILADEQVKLIFDAGGNGSDEVIEYLKNIQLTMRPDIVMCGFSDGDQLLNYLGEIGAVSPVQALPPGALNKNKEAAEATRKFLFKQEIEDVGLQCLNSAAQASGSIEGKLVVFNGHSRRASYSTIIDAEYGSILLLEATQQASRRNVAEGLQFALDSMEKQGQRPRAILLSQSDLLHSLEQVAEIRRIAEESAIPIFSGAPFGHDSSINSVPLPLHTDVKITVSGVNATLNISPVRAVEDVEKVKEVCESRAPYFVDPAPISEEAISIPDVTVARVYGQVGNEGELSEADIVNGVKEIIDAKEFLLTRAVRICQRCEATDLDCIDLFGKNVLIDFEGMSPPRSRQDEEKCLSRIVQDAQTTLMELLKTGQLQKASSLIFLLRGEIPNGFNLWLKDFAEGHDLHPDFFVGQAPENVELFPDGPPQTRGSVTLIRARMKVAERLEEKLESASGPHENPARVDLITSSSAGADLAVEPYLASGREVAEKFFDKSEKLLTTEPKKSFVEAVKEQRESTSKNTGSERK